MLFPFAGCELEFQENQPQTGITNTHKVLIQVLSVSRGSLTTCDRWSELDSVLSEPPVLAVWALPLSKRGIEVRYSIPGLAIMQMLAQSKSSLLRVRKFRVNCL